MLYCSDKNGRGFVVKKGMIPFGVFLGVHVFSSFHLSLVTCKVRPLQGFITSVHSTESCKTSKLEPRLCDGARCSLQIPDR